MSTIHPWQESSTPFTFLTGSAADTIVLDEQAPARELEPTPDPAWVLSYDGYSVLNESAVESGFAFGNGFLGMRAARSVSRGPTWLSWLGYSRWASWPRCYVAGLFDIPNTEPPVPALVPVADWSRVRILLDGEPLLVREGELLLGTRKLDMRRGLLLSSWRHRTPAGITATGRELRLLSLADRAVGLQLLQLSLDRHDVDVRLEASFAMAGLGMEPMQLEQDLGSWRMEGTGKGVSMTGAATLRLDGDSLVAQRPFSLRWIWGWRSVAGQVAEFDRLVAVARADTADDDPGPRASATLERSRALGWRAVLAAHEAAWSTRWIASDIRIEGDEEAQRAARFAVYHLTSAANPEDERVSIGARALTGDAYLGHVFWDTEIYLLPFYSVVWPEAARALLMYRFHTLPAARAKAVHFGFKGALYAWESADTGVETTPERVVGADGTLIDILTGRMEHHISADVAYAVWQYWRATGDDDFLLSAGAEILLDTARFWASRAQPEADGWRHIRHVIGPDEYHEDVDDNAFTNLMARWNIARALEALGLLHARWPDHAARLCKKLALDDDELADWRDAVDRIVTGLDPASGIYEQFRGFHALERLDLGAYADRTVPIDVVIGRERTQHSQVVKQADVVALIALLPEEFPGAMAAKNFRHYEPLCAHGSSLSAGMHALVAARLGDAEMALRYLRETAATDLDLDPDSAGGVRIAGLGALWQAVMLGFVGLDMTGDKLGIDPKLPPQWRHLSFRVRWRGRSVAIRIAGATVQATLEQGEAMEMRVASVTRELTPGATLHVEAATPEGSTQRSEHARAITRDKYDAVLLDLDGVITDTAALHAACWKQMFDEYLKESAARSGEAFRPFDLDADYRLYVDGKPRFDGVRDFLASRRISLPEGSADDPAEAETISGLGNRKNLLVGKAIEEFGVTPYAGSVRFVRQFHRDGFKIAVVTSSQNCSAVLAAAGLDAFFDVRVDGNAIEEQHLTGKPAPDTFLLAAQLLGVKPERAVVIEDAISGVEAGSRGRFGLVIGVARKGNAEELRRHGAHLVVNDLAELVG
ncbi:MAG: beta-phosphoglucomutase family hydrolase [Xanthobacteraceae bacterium]|nr:beta-phosphoglucomutase family hydrolase [Xanthobacteraceae bacterium]